MLGIVKLELVESDSDWDLFCSLSKQGTFFSKSQFFSELKIPNQRYFFLNNREILAAIALTLATVVLFKLKNVLNKTFIGQV